jgi:glycosyltransferase involved in cell wall biosynthesis
MSANIGIYNWCMGAKGGGEKLSLVMAAHLSRRHDVWLFVPEGSDVGELGRYFNVDLSRVKAAPLNSPGLAFRALAVARGRPKADQGAALLHHYLQIRKLKLDLFINNTYGSDLVCPSARGIYMCMFPHQSRPPRGLSRRARAALKSLTVKAVTGSAPAEMIDSYTEVAAITRYTGEWVRRLWGRDPHIIYPACDRMGPASAKEKIILHVGRFTAERGGDEHHHKGQRVLLETFGRLGGIHEDGWQLHFVGSVGRDEESANFAAALAEKARGLPVTFHFDADFGKLRDLYRRASIYWHATGYGYPAEEFPAKQEHFGITTVEAMSAGAVPVVIASGGQKEIVTHEADGLLWEALDGLAAQTVRLVRDENLRARLARQAVLSSERFSREAFAASMDRLVDALLPDGPGA